MSEFEAEDTPSYAVRMSPRAQQDLGEAADRLAELAQDLSLAEEWANGVYEEVGNLARHPRRHAVTEWETRLFEMETRQMLYRRTSGSVAYRIFYSVEDETADGPVVTILHVRHSGRKPLTRREARRILANQ